MLLFLQRSQVYRAINLLLCVSFLHNQDVTQAAGDKLSLRLPSADANFKGLRFASLSTHWTGRHVLDAVHLFEHLSDLVDLGVLALNGGKQLLYSLSQEFFDLLLQQWSNRLDQLFCLGLLLLCLRLLRALDELEQIGKLEFLLARVFEDHAPFLVSIEEDLAGWELVSVQ